MISDFDKFVDDLQRDDGVRLAATPKKTDTKVVFKCTQCNGTGLWNGGRVNQHGNNKCWTCGGAGTIKTDPRKLAKARDQRRARKVQAFNDGIAAIKEQHPDLFAELNDVYIHAHSYETNGFILSIATQLFTRGTLTDGQIAAWYRGKAKLEAIREQRAAEQRESAITVDLAPIREMFERAVANGYKKPTYRAEGLIISRAPDTGNNPGALYVKNVHNTYGGKIVDTTFQPNRDGKANTFTEVGDAATALRAIAEDPLNAALRYGQRTGRCACCGRELTNHGSIDAGIGPICREKWGL